MELFAAPELLARAANDDEPPAMRDDTALLTETFERRLRDALRDGRVVAHDHASRIDAMPSGTAWAVLTKSAVLKRAQFEQFAAMCDVSVSDMPTDDTQTDESQTAPKPASEAVASESAAAADTAQQAAASGAAPESAGADERPTAPEPASDVAPAPSLAPAASMVVTNHQKRIHPPRVEIEEAQRRAADSDDPSSVYGELQKLAEQQFGVLIGYSSDGVQYRGAEHQKTGVPDVLTKKNLADRMRRAKAR
ncbi:hypothetical protein E1N52_41645 [Paraburkholderia guartelaensis]|uniref:Uncharacterized protein n=1 Tax=Paraburkholderia guartelaensis TaxID=2546446 RepID=A0A4V2ZUT5_9BURK|nr:hypothetical protein [Paraburkholderia guartelaensis]TDG02095.1 hypothetical protein E1N52_41645 [Paraburkholderia guartelaensis]